MAHLYPYKDPFVCPKNPGFHPRSNPMTWGWDVLDHQSILWILRVLHSWIPSTMGSSMTPCTKYLSKIS